MGKDWVSDYADIYITNVLEEALFKCPLKSQTYTDHIGNPRS